MAEELVADPKPDPAQGASTFEVPLHTLDKVTFLDPAGGKNKQQGKHIKLARHAIVTIGQDQEYRIFVLHTYVGRVPVPDLVKMMFEINRNFRPRVFGGEANALQHLFQEAVKMIAKDRNEPLPLYPVEHSTKIDKDFRIRTTLQPIIAEGRLILGPNQQELEAELEGFPRYLTKDLVDALASAITLLPQKPLRQQRDQEAEALAEYLRKTGAPDWYIEQRAPTALRPDSMLSMLHQAGRLGRPLPLHLQRKGA